MMKPLKPQDPLEALSVSWLLSNMIRIFDAVVFMQAIQPTIIDNLRMDNRPTEFIIRK